MGVTYNQNNEITIIDVCGWENCWLSGAIDTACYFCETESLYIVIVII